MKKLTIAALFLTSTMLPGQVLGVGNFTHVVENLDRSIEFYRTLGLKMIGTPTPFSVNPAISSLYDAPGAQSRMASFEIPDSDLVVEIVEFQGLQAKPAPSRFFDPGAVQLHFGVPDLEAVKDRLVRLKGLEWPAASKCEATVRDPDGIFVDLLVDLREVREQPLLSLLCRQETEVQLEVTVEDLDRSAGFYREALGFTDGPRGRLWIPGAWFPLRLVAPGWADRKPLHPSVHDPGAGVLQLLVSDFDSVLEAMKAAGATVVSSGGQPVNPGANRAVILRGPDNFFLQVQELAPPAGQGAAK